MIQMLTGRQRPQWKVAFAWSGGALFAATLVTAGHVYLSRFGQPAAPASAGRALRAVALDTVLLTAFAVHHSVFARPPLKTWMQRHAPAGLERPIYVWIASILFLAVLWAWAPVPGTWWQARGGAAIALLGVQAAGVIVTAVASARLGVFELAGLRPEAPPRLRQGGLYGIVRHPIYFGWLLMVWPTPVMTGSRLTFAALTTAYLVAIVPFEERALRRTFGPAYDAYAHRVRWRMLWGLY
jgi:protein-S-isoprenylcysteine O-methyltransferase Ste14